ncbi:putative peroxisomal lipase YBR204C [Kluyveromyces marxianus]|uniref:Peroxisomal lipase YBR204C n=2 Tax=Kluyveromyces marxianus TaxID=4911 RepID=A0ABX6ENX7_KLUMA|nr:uncharacterized protein KLMA_10741 [Kluyveromyces marxianus DMKU3-1042]QGN13461.1 putative peroxisomal lipase YBR204C [Kluyveromyces marxianus]BAO38363.1 putative peroxisomal lipase YBR204C [Kluyveromyces marxianus DMKU3-1042]BAP69921.1 putative peroxisomal lipase YBR204C [Kluyveromyces marxianus]
MGFYHYPTPLSGIPTDKVVEKYNGNNHKLNEQVLSNAKDFHNEIVESHLDVVEVPIKGKSVQIQTCHNIRSEVRNEKFVLMIHGLGGNLTHFEPLISRFSEDNTPFITLDLPGFGDSGNLDRYDMNDVTSVICELVYKVCHQHQFKSVDIIGHSMGCILAAHVSKKIKYKCAQLIFLGTPPMENKALQNPLVRLILKLLWFFPGIFDFYRVKFDQSKGLDSSGIRKFYYRSGNTYGKLYQFYRNIQIKSKTLVGYFLGWHDVQLSELNADVPIHLIHGDKDEVCTLEKLQKWTRLENSTLDVIPDCSHNCLLDATSETLELINKYLQIGK